MSEKKNITIPDALITDKDRFLKFQTDGLNQSGTFTKILDKAQQHEQAVIDLESALKEMNQQQIENNYFKEELEKLQVANNDLVLQVEELTKKPPTPPVIDTAEVERLNNEIIKINTANEKQLTQLKNGLPSENGLQIIVEFKLPIAQAARKYRKFVTEKEKFSGNPETYISELSNIAIKRYINNKFDADL